MSARKHYILLAAIACLAAVDATTAFAGKEEERPRRTVTVYISEHGGSGIAKEMNEMHDKMEAAGYRYADMEIHSENGDTEGVLITYVR